MPTYKWKISVLGDASVGKTSLVRHFCDGYFKENYLSTIGVSFLRKNIEIDNNKIILQLWDIGGQQVFGGALRENYLRGSHGALIMFDLTKKATLAHVKQWIEEVYAVCPNIPLVLIGNKSDLPHKDNMTAKGKKMAESAGAEFYVTSAKTGNHMKEVFLTVTNKIIEYSEKIKKSTNLR